MNNQDYYKKYLKKQPEKAIKNRLFQRNRSRQSRGAPDAGSKLIAKMDV